MRRLLAVLILLAALPALAAVETTTIIFNVVTPGAVAATSGTVTLVLSAPGTAPDGGGSVAVAGRTTANIAPDGSVSIVVVPNDVITPAGTYYTFQFLVRTPTVSSWTQTRLVATSPDPSSLGDCAQTNPPLGAPTPVSQIQDEGTDIHRCAKVNFTGAGAAATYNSGTGACIVDVTGGFTDQFGWVLYSPTSSNDPIVASIPAAGTLTRVDCIVVGGTSVDIVVEECTSTGTSCTANTATITCDIDGATTSTFGGGAGSAIDAQDFMRINIGTVTGSVTFVSVFVTYTR